MKKSIKDSLKFDRTSIIGLMLLVTSFVTGALLRNAAMITNETTRQFRSTCDTYLRELCIPTFYISIPLFSIGSLVINVTSFLVSLTLFILGVVLVRK